MAQSVKLDKVITSLVDSAPPGELNKVKSDLSTILSSSNNRLIDSSLEKYVNEHGTIFSGKHIASKLNKQAGSTKYIDYVSGVLFNVDLDTQQAIDIEQYAVADVPPYFEELVSKLQAYGDEHCPSTFAFNVIPDGADLYIQIIGQRLNNENFYTGQWNSTYAVKNDTISGTVKVDIHYYEDGNVRLNYDDAFTGHAGNAASIVNFINNSENQLTLKIVDSFNQLNQKYFKNLRRLLPVTRAKINWGNAIGNYRLGADVVNSK